MPPVILLTGAGAGDNITLPLDINEPTLVVLGAPPLLNEVGGRVVAIVVGEVGPVDKGSEVEELRGGLGLLEMVSHVLESAISSRTPKRARERGCHELKS